ncbi:hypothetical protein FKM82_016163 [Ascaphus truei]
MQICIPCRGRGQHLMALSLMKQKHKGSALHASYSPPCILLTSTHPTHLQAGGCVRSPGNVQLRIESRNWIGFRRKRQQSVKGFWMTLDVFPEGR